MNKAIWIGFDPREHDAFVATINSIRAHLSEDIPIFGIKMDVLQARGLYQRPTIRRGAQLWDQISDAPMSTEFALSRFFVPHICTEEVDTALFMDCDMLVRRDLVELFAELDPSKAVQVVKHCQPEGGMTKMDDQIQTHYERKNWSSVMLWNLRHPATGLLTLHRLNQWGGRALHQLKWLEDHEIGDLDRRWNHLVGIDAPDPEAKIAHFTLGIPRMQGYENCEFSQEWWQCVPA